MSAVESLRAEIDRQLEACGCMGMCDSRGGCQLQQLAGQRHKATLISIARERRDDAIELRRECVKQARVLVKQGRRDLACGWLSMARKQNQQAVRCQRTARQAARPIVGHDFVQGDVFRSAEPMPDYNRPTRAALPLKPFLWGAAIWAALIVGVLMGRSVKADITDVEGNVAAYLQDNPSIADQFPIAAAEETSAGFGFVTESGRNVQIGLTALMLLDTAQTVTIARSPECLREADPIAAAVFGSEHPSTQRVLITNALYIGLNWIVASKLDRLAQRSDSWARARRAYQVLSFLGHGAAVANNIGLGIRPFSKYGCGQ